jgi:hypothetical protein
VTRSGGYAGVPSRVAGRRVDVAARVKVTVSLGNRATRGGKRPTKGFESKSDRCGKRVDSPSALVRT